MAFVTVTRLVFTAIWSFALFFDIAQGPRIGNQSWTSKLVMLTNINFLLFTIYSHFTFFTTLFPVRGVKRWVDYAYFTSLYPTGVATCALFWGLYAVDPNLVMPDWIRRLIPAWLNHVTHTLPALHLIVEMFLEKKSVPTKKHMIVVSTILVSFYFGILFYVRYYEGYWLYPLLSILATEHFIGAFVCSILIFFLFTISASVINQLIHRGKAGRIRTAGKEK